MNMSLYNDLFAYCILNEAGLRVLHSDKDACYEIHKLRTQVFHDIMIRHKMTCDEIASFIGSTMLKYEKAKTLFWSSIL